jgi:hypothetical protein
MHFAGTGDGFSVRICLREVEAAFELAHGILAEDMLDLFGVVVNVVGTVLHDVREVELPEAMISHDGTGFAPAFGGEVEHAAVVGEGGELLAEEFIGLEADLLQGLASGLGEIEQGDAFLTEVTTLGEVVHGFEGVFAFDTAFLSFLPPEPREPALLRTEQKGHREHE